MDGFDLDGAFAAFGILLVFVMIVIIAFCIFAIIGKWKLFKKCGKEGWEAIVPFYSTYILLEIAGMKWWWLLISILPSFLSRFIDNSAITWMLNIVGYVVDAAVAFNLQKRFHKSQGWFILSIFFGGITIPILGYSNTDVYDPTVPVPENSFFGGEMVYGNGVAQPQPNQPYGPNYYQSGQPAPGPMPGPMGQPVPGPMPGQPVPGPMGQPVQPDLGQPVQPEPTAAPEQPAAPVEPQAPSVDGSNNSTNM